MICDLKEEFALVEKKHSLVNWILLLLVVVCVADLVHMTYRKIVSQSSAAAVEQTGMEALQLTSDNVQAGTAFVEQQDQLTFEGQLAVDKQEIPWQTNCGVVQDEATGTSIFLTPNTALAFACKPSAGQSLVFAAEIFAAVQPVSDGCSLRVQIFDANTQTQLTESTLQIPSSEQSQNFSVDLSEYEDQAIWVRLACGNGQNNNDDGDWLFLTSCSIQ